MASHIPCSGSSTHAAEKSCLLVAEHLSHYREDVYRLLQEGSGWKFTFLGGPRTRDGSIPGIPWGVLKNRFTVKNYWLGGRILWQSGVVKQCLWGKYDAVIFVGNALFLSTWLGTALLRARRVPVYFWTIGWHKRDRHVLKRIIRKIFYGMADHLLLYGSDGYGIGLAEGIPPEKMTVIGNSFSGRTTPTAEAAGEEVDVKALLGPPGARLIGAVVRVNDEKRLDMLIDAVGLLRSHGQDLAVLLTAGPATDGLQSRAKGLGVPMLLTGPVYGDKGLAEIYGRLSVTVIPEMAGLTVIQSLAMGVPVITADDPDRQVPEFRAVKHGKTGFLYAAGMVDSLAATIRECLDLIDQRGDEVAAACRNEIEENWTVGRHAVNILDALGRRSRSVTHLGD